MYRNEVAYLDIMERMGAWARRLPGARARRQESARDTFRRTYTTPPGFGELRAVLQREGELGWEEVWGIFERARLHGVHCATLEQEWLPYAQDLMASWSDARRLMTSEQVRDVLDGLNQPHVRLVRALKIDQVRLDLRELEELASHCDLWGIRELTLERTMIDAYGLNALVKAPMFEHMRVLRLAGNAFSEAGAKILAVRAMPELERLEIERCGLRDEGVAALLATEVHGALHTLSFADNVVSEHAVVELGRTSRMRTLRSLDLSGTRLTGAAAEALAATGVLEGLEALALDRNALGPDSVCALLERGRTLGRISLDYNPIGPEGARALADHGCLARTPHLHLSKGALGDSGFDALVSSPHVRALKRLHVGFNSLGPAAMSALRLGALCELEELDLTENHVGDQGVLRLLEWDGVSGLGRLDLARNEIRDAGAIALANAPQLCNVEHLSLAENQISDDGALALARSPTLAQCDLFLDRNPGISERCAQMLEPLRRSRRVWF